MLTKKELIKIFEYYIDKCGAIKTNKDMRIGDLLNIRHYPNMCLELHVNNLRDLERPIHEYVDNYFNIRDITIFSLKYVRFYIKFLHHNLFDYYYINDHCYTFDLKPEDALEFTSIAGGYIDECNIKNHNFNKAIEKIVIDRFMNKIVHDHHMFIKNKYDLK